MGRTAPSNGYAVALERKHAVPGTPEYLEVIHERHRRERERLLSEFPDPESALEDFMRANFDAETVAEVLREWEEGEDNEHAR